MSSLCQESKQGILSNRELALTCGYSAFITPGFARSVLLWVSRTSALGAASGCDVLDLVGGQIVAAHCALHMPGCYCTWFPNDSESRAYGIPERAGSPCSSGGALISWPPSLPHLPLLGGTEAFHACCIKDILRRTCLLRRPFARQMCSKCISRCHLGREIHIRADLAYVPTTIVIR